MRKLPSSNLLVTFDAAARHLSFKQAAEELFVTPSAVGHQIRVLEKELNVLLFLRSNRSIELTTAGKQYHEKISSALNTLRQATVEITASQEEKSLLIHSIPYLANTLLVPNIKTFKKQFPDLKISIEADMKRATFSPGVLQLALRQGKEESDQLCFTKIFDLQVTPVCAPDYCQQEQRTKIQLSSDLSSWKNWQAQWPTKLDFSDTLHCNTMQVAYDMAQQGLGVAMGYLPVLTPLLNEGKLTMLYPDQITESDAIYLVYAKEHQHEPEVKAFIDWLQGVIQPYLR